MARIYVYLSLPFLALFLASLIMFIMDGPSWSLFWSTWGPPLVQTGGGGAACLVFAWLARKEGR